MASILMGLDWYLMRILLLITGLGVGGAERQVVDLADTFVAAGHEVLLACLTGPATIRPIDPSISLVTMGMAKGFMGFVRAVAAFRKLIESFKPDIVHTHLVHANLFARVLRIWIPMPVLISSAHNSNEEGWWRMLGYMVTDRLASLSTNVSVEAVKSFERWHAVRKGRMVAVYNGIPTAKFRFDLNARQRIRTEIGVAEDCNLLLAVGRLYPQKDYPNLLHAIKLLRHRFPQLIVAIAGDGPLLPDLKILAHDLSLNELQIVFLGIREDVAALMSAADVFVLPSAWEGFGLVVAEAMSCERIVVATNSGGVREVLGDCGFLVAPRDPVKLADSLKSALELDPLDRERIGLAARHRIENLYSIDSASETWLKLYQHLSNQAAMATQEIP